MLSVWFIVYVINLASNFIKVSNILMLFSRTFSLTFGMYPHLLLIYSSHMIQTVPFIPHDSTAA
jgi:hypothetical protein